MSKTLNYNLTKDHYKIIPINNIFPESLYTSGDNNCYVPNTSNIFIIFGKNSRANNKGISMYFLVPPNYKTGTNITITMGVSGSAAIALINSTLYAESRTENEAPSWQINGTIGILTPSEIVIFNNIYYISFTLDNASMSFSPLDFVKIRLLMDDNGHAHSIYVYTIYANVTVTNYD